ncbi:MAG: hypothetical protein JZU50_03745 [Desulfobulbaceae bacterium]|nr:hypothetical protein [Desulfobulbaceae bacterium]
MTATEIIQATRADGLDIALSPDGKIKVNGKRPVVDRWRLTLIEHKDEIIHLLNREPGGSVGPAPSIPPWCDPRCECFCRLEFPGLDVILGCYQEADSRQWRWSRLDKMAHCPKIESNGLRTIDSTSKEQLP